VGAWRELGRLGLGLFGERGVEWIGSVAMHIRMQKKVGRVSYGRHVEKQVVNSSDEN
jgi:hypothetical protein